MPTSLTVERWAPMGLAALVTLAWWWLDGEISGNIAKELLAALIGAASICAGFLTTALSILLPIATSATGRKLQRSGYRELLFKYMRSAIYSCIALAGIATAAFFTVKADGPSRLISFVIIYNATHAAASLLRVAEILLTLFERASEPDDKDG